MLRPRSPRVLLPLLSAMAAAGCATTPAAGPTEEPLRLPAWFDASGLSVAPALELEQAASLICGRGSGAPVDDEVRRLTGLADGLVTAHVLIGTDAAALRTRLAAEARALLGELQATHAGFAEGQLMGDERCAAVVGVRRLLDVQSALPTQVAPEEPFPLRLALAGAPAPGAVAPGAVAQGAVAPGAGAASGPASATPTVTAYVMNPLGFVSRRELTPAADGSFEDVIVPTGLSGRWVLELMVAAADDPEVALWWSFDVGEGSGKPPPHPEVLFPDEGHGDVALTRRAEALVQRLRTQQELEVFRIAPALSRVAGLRASALAEAAGIGHRRTGRGPLEDLAAHEPGFGFSRVAEVQAQAGTLAEAWAVLLESPAHRYQLVQAAMTHFGAAVVRSTDGGGRGLVTLVVLLVRRSPPRVLRELETELIGRLNLARHAQGRAPLKTHPVLQAVCAEQAAAMAARGAVDDRALGSPTAEIAVERAEGLEEARAVLAALDDPLRLAPSDATLQPSMNGIGVAVREVSRGPDARYVLCVLVGRGPAEEGAGAAP